MPAAGIQGSFGSAAELRAAVGDEFGPGEWLVIDQDRIDAFAAATNDHQWIHVDPARAASGPFGATIAHGLLIQSLVPYLVGRIVAVTGFRMAVNYGSDRVRFVTPVRCGARRRARPRLRAPPPPRGGGRARGRRAAPARGP
ncbi:MaoC family dehydratase, partial [Frankia sp. CNm7]|uniref:MaoC family dehydratase n=1 Tax=Frankia nepalensis TaxID=1836974 RepID=UPI0019324E79